MSKNLKMVIIVFSAVIILAVLGFLGYYFRDSLFTTVSVSKKESNVQKVVMNYEVAEGNALNDVIDFPSATQNIFWTEVKDGDTTKKELYSYPEGIRGDKNISFIGFDESFWRQSLDLGGNWPPDKDTSSGANKYRQSPLWFFQTDPTEQRLITNYLVESKDFSQKDAVSGIDDNSKIVWTSLKNLEISFEVYPFFDVRTDYGVVNSYKMEYDEKGGLDLEADANASETYKAFGEEIFQMSNINDFFVFKLVGTTPEGDLHEVTLPEGSLSFDRYGKKATLKEEVLLKFNDQNLGFDNNKPIQWTLTLSAGRLIKRVKLDNTFITKQYCEKNKYVGGDYGVPCPDDQNKEYLYFIPVFKITGLKIDLEGEAPLSKNQSNGGSSTQGNDPQTGITAIIIPQRNLGRELGATPAVISPNSVIIEDLMPTEKVRVTCGSDSSKQYKVLHAKPSESFIDVDDKLVNKNQAVFLDVGVSGNIDKKINQYSFIDQSQNKAVCEGSFDALTRFQGITAIYKNVLGRNYDPRKTDDELRKIDKDEEGEGMKFWDTSGMDISNILIAIALDPRYKEVEKLVNEAARTQGERTAVELIYERFLGRSCDEAGCKFWTDVMKNSLTPMGVLKKIILSEEMLSYSEDLSRLSQKEKDVHLLFLRAFYRKADDDALKYYSNKSYREALEEVARSNEFIDKTKDLSDKEFIESVYLTILERAPEVGNPYLDRLQQGKLTRPQMIEEILQSQEGIKKSSK